MKGSWTLYTLLLVSLLYSVMPSDMRQIPVYTQNKVIWAEPGVVRCPFWPCGGVKEPLPKQPIIIGKPWKGDH